MTPATTELEARPALVTARKAPVQVYVSAGYSDRSVAARIATLLLSKGYDVVWERDLGALDSEARLAAATAPCVLALLSRASQTSKWLIEEAEQALARDALQFVLLDAVPSPLERRATYEPIDLVGWNGDPDDGPGWRMLLDRVAQMAGPPSGRGASKLPMMIAQFVAFCGLAVLTSVATLQPTGPTRSDTADADVGDASAQGITAQGGLPLAAEPTAEIEPDSAAPARLEAAAEAFSPMPIPATASADVGAPPPLETYNATPFADQPPMIAASAAELMPVEPASAPEDMLPR